VIISIENRLVDVSLVAKKSGYATRTIRNWANAGILPGIKDGVKLWKFEPTVVNDFMAQAVRTTPPRRRNTEGRTTPCISPSI
jgi:hypothetical protein